MADVSLLLLAEARGAVSRRMRPLRLLILLLCVCLIELVGLGARSWASDRPVEGYFKFVVDEDRLQGAPDQSALNQALMPSDRIGVAGGHFVKVGPDGRLGTPDDQRVRLWGVNLTFAANFPEAPEAVQLARRLRRLGFNAVRLHHLDSHFSDPADPPNGILTRGPFPDFNPQAVQRLRALISALSAEGLYVNLNLHVGYRFRPVEDGLTKAADGSAPAALTGPEHVFDPVLVGLQQRYATQLLGLLQLKNDAALAMVEINNESSLAATWQRSSVQEWSDWARSRHGQMLATQWTTWAGARYGSVAQACAAWHLADCGGALSLVAPDQVEQWGDGWWPRARAWWLYRLAGVRKRVMAWLGAEAAGDTLRPMPQRTLDFMRFLAETDAHYFRTLRETVRSSVSGEVPVTGTQVGYGNALNLSSHESMDYIDEHFYLDHYQFPGRSWDMGDWYIRNQSLAGGALPELLALAWHRVQGKPFVVSEFNQPYPNQYGAEILPMMAALASVQDWDGLFFFEYGKLGLPMDRPDTFNLSGDPGKLAVAGASARLFRQAWVPPAADAVLLPVPDTLRLDLAAQRQEDGLRWYAEQVLRLPGLEALSRRIALDPSGAAPTPVSGRTQSDAGAGALSHDPEKGQLRLRAERVAAWFGFLRPGEQLQLGPISFASSERLPQFHVALLLSQDGLPLARSERLWLSVPGAVVGSQPDLASSRPRRLVPRQGNHEQWAFEPEPTHPDKPSGGLVGDAPAWMSDAAASLTLGPPSAPWRIWGLDGAGQRQGTAPVGRTLSVATPWFELDRPMSAGGERLP